MLGIMVSIADYGSTGRQYMAMVADDSQPSIQLLHSAKVLTLMAMAMRGQH